MSDWNAHVQAQVDLDAGRNTEAETKAVWTTTRTRGPARADAFDEAAVAWRGCTGTPEPAACTEATDATLDAASDAVGDWRRHLRAMADRKAGHIGSYHAQQMWVATYRSAPINIDKYRNAARDAEEACR